MANLVDEIENYLKRLLHQTGVIEIQRNELAKKFMCVPSQINYVLQTRFTLDRGYLIESRRGGGGYVRIERIRLASDEALQQVLQEGIGEAISQEKAEGFINRFYEEGIITEREALLIKTAMKKEVLRIDLPYRDIIRANILKAMILVLWRCQDQ